MNTSETILAHVHRPSAALVSIRGILRGARILAIKNIYKNIISAPE